MSNRIDSLRFDSATETRQKLKRVVIGVIALVAILLLLPSTFTYVNPGYVGIVIHRGAVASIPCRSGPECMRVYRSSRESKSIRSS
jgi:hypothetical protein